MTDKKIVDSVLQSERRRDWALYTLTGGGIAMTIFCLICVHLLQTNPKYIFYLALAGQANIAVLFGGIAGLLVKRTISVTRDGLVMEDHDFRNKQS